MNSKTEIGGRKTDGFKLIQSWRRTHCDGVLPLLQANGINIMVDCGLAQGDDVLLPMKSWPVSPSEIDYLFLTHVYKGRV